MTTKQRVIHHIRVGDPSWGPTDAELKKIEDQFKQASFDAHGVAFVATSHLVRVDTISVDSDLNPIFSGVIDS